MDCKAFFMAKFSAVFDSLFKFPALLRFSLLSVEFSLKCDLVVDGQEEAPN